MLTEIAESSDSIFSYFFSLDSPSHHGISESMKLCLFSNTYLNEISSCNKYPNVHKQITFVKITKYP